MTGYFSGGYMDDNVKDIALIGAVSANGVYGIGRGSEGRLAWESNKRDMAFFKKETTGHTVIMSRGTWLSLPKKARPLPERINIVVTRNQEFRLDDEDIEK